MPASKKKFVFRPLVVVASALATALSILLPLFQVVGWINENLVWSLWAAIVVLSVTTMLLVARVAALKETVTAVRAEVDVAGQRADAAKEDAEAARSALEARLSAASPEPAAALSNLDRSLADHLFAYASNTALLTMLGNFFEYQIPREPVQMIEQLGELRLTRTAHDPELEGHLDALVDAAQTWRSKLLPVVSLDGDYYTTKIRENVPYEVYKQNEVMTDELVEAGFDLHAKLLAYQKYYASL